MDFSMAAIILAAGVGSRMGGDKTKQRIILDGKSVLKRTLLSFEAASSVKKIIVVTREDEIEFAKGEAGGINKPVKVTLGGACRAESARLGFLEVGEDIDLVAIHDAARCLVTPEMIDRVAYAADIYGCASAACRVHDTVKIIDNNGFAVGTQDRSSLMRAQTPQIFKHSLYKKAIEAVEIDESITDDNSLLERLGERIFLVDTGNNNIKITEPSDIPTALGIIRDREGGKMGIRIGHGYDVHRFAAGRELVLGGVSVPHTTGLLGHSDADVLLHAIMDALLGAAAFGDIGKHFPDNSAEYLGASSLNLLTKVGKLLSDNGYSVSNIDATLVLQAPKIAPFIDKMRENIAFALNVDVSSVSVKATTEEKLGFTGSGEGAAAHAVALITK